MNHLSSPLVTDAVLHIDGGYTPIADRSANIRGLLRETRELILGGPAARDHELFFVCKDMAKASEPSLNQLTWQAVSCTSTRIIPEKSEMDAMTVTLSRSIHQRSLAVIGLCVVDAALMVTSGFIHLHLQQTAYQHVKTLGPLFIVQFVSCLVVAAALLVTRHILVALAGVALMAGTIVGFILARTVGIFDFKLPYSTTLANQVLVVEAAAVVVGLLTAWVMWHHRLD